jgi:hypothetical protein
MNSKNKTDIKCQTPKKGIMTFSDITKSLSLSISCLVMSKIDEKNIKNDLQSQ